MPKKVTVRFDSDAYSEFVKLKNLVLKNSHSTKKPTYQQLLSSIEKVITILKENPFYGNLVPRKYLSQKIVMYYGTDKILRVELVGYWRLLYTLVGEEVEIITLILDFMCHDDYNNIFGYKKK